MNAKDFFYKLKIAKNRDGLFSTDNLHRLIVAVVGGILLFMLSQGYQNIFGPQRVVIEATVFPHSGVMTSIDAMSKPPATEEEIQRAAREAEMINSTRKKQGI